MTAKEKLERTKLATQWLLERLNTIHNDSDTYSSYPAKFGGLEYAVEFTADLLLHPEKDSYIYYLEETQ